MASRRKQNRMKTKRDLKSLVKGLGRLTVLIALAGALYGLFQVAVEYMKLSEIQIIGNKVISASEIMQKAELNYGISLLRLDSDVVRERLLRVGWFEDVSVRKELPWRLIIKVKEKSPVAIVRTPEGPYLVDPSGRLIERIDEAVALLPVIEVSIKDRKTFAEALALAELVKTSSFFDGKTVVITGRSPETLALNIDGLRIFMGSRDYERKIKKLVKIQRLLLLRDIPVEYVDLRFKGRAIVRTRRVSVDG